MSRCFEAFIDDLCEKTGYDYDFLVDIYNDCVNDPDDGDVDSFVAVTMERDW